MEREKGRIMRGGGGSRQVSVREDDSPRLRLYSVCVIERDERCGFRHGYIDTTVRVAVALKVNNLHNFFFFYFL